MRATGLLLAVAGVGAGFLASRWVLEQDRIVVGRFEGRRFSVPSKVLSATTILYPGLDWKRVQLPETLGRLGYRTQTASKPLAVGRYRWYGETLHVHLRGFDHPSRSEPRRIVSLELAGSRIREIRDRTGGGRGREVAAVLLEPELVGAYYGPNREQRELISFAELPRQLTDAVLAVEDQRFESHHGIDWRRILGAMVANLRAGGIRQGGSTLTQQLVKNFFLTPAQTLERKITEAVMALLVEARYDKEAILESYLNEIYLGQRGATEVHGVGEAARFYFGKHASELSTAESALLAAIVQSPNWISPHRHPERALKRRDLVIRLMYEQGRLSREQAELALDEPLRVAPITAEEGESRYFLDVLRRQLPDAYTQQVLSSDGLRIYSTLNPRLQRAAVRALRKGLDNIAAQLAARDGDGSRRSSEPLPDPSKLQGCIVAMRPQTGEILALVGGREYGKSQFDRCTQARRQAGSAFKPIAYIAGLEPGPDGEPVITPATLLSDSPLQIETSHESWEPQNFDLKFRGPVTARHALEKSLNIPAVRLGLEIGPDRIADVARRLGVTSPLPIVPSLPLGTAELAPIELARVYATIANGGLRSLPHTFEDMVAGGEMIERRKLGLERVLDAGVAYLATSLLEGVVDRGTGQRVRSMGLRGAVAGKTGTTDDEHDLWFVGFTPELLVVVWVGYDTPAPVGVQSSRGALPIWVDFMLEAVGPDVRGEFPRPASVRELDIHPETGAVAMEGCPKRQTEYFLRGTEPLEICSGPMLAANVRDGNTRERTGPRQERRRESSSDRDDSPNAWRKFWGRLFGR